MKPLALALSAAFMVALLTGCACPFARPPAAASSTPAPRVTEAYTGCIVDQEYRPIHIGEDRARLSVVYAPGSIPMPTRWYLLDDRGHERRRPVTPVADPIRPCSFEAETRALMFELEPAFAALNPCVTPPQPRMITLIEKQHLVVTISYHKPRPGKESPKRGGEKGKGGDVIGDR